MVQKKDRVVDMVFVDTVALIALGDKSDYLHSQALEVRKKLLELRKRFVTTSAVILELCNAFSEVDDRHSAVSIVDAIHRSKLWECIHVDESLMQKGYDRFKERPDKEWSLIDCISIIVSEERRIQEIFTSDRHFTQAGFNKLLYNPEE